MIDLPPSEAEQRALAHELPLEIVREEAENRGLLSEVGNTAAEAGGVVYLAEQISPFLDPEARPGLADQLSVSAAFWQAVGRQVPGSVTTEQFGRLGKSLDSGGHYRLVPTPLLSPAERIETVKRTNTLLPKKLNADLGLVVPNEVWQFADLVKDPNGTVQAGGRTYGMGYKTPSAQKANRETYAEELLKEGHAVRAEDGTVWVFPIVDVQTQTPPRSGETALGAYESVGFSDTPETLLTVQLLRLINGSATTGSAELDITNEAIFELDETGRPEKLAMLGSIAWISANGKAEKLYQNFWQPDTQSDGFGFRVTISAMSADRL